MDVWRRMIAAQGGDPDAQLPVAREQHVVTAPSSGVLTRLDAYGVGVAAWRSRRGPGPQGGPGAGRCGRRTARQAGRHRHGRPAADDPAHGHPEKFDYALASLDGAWDIAGEGAAFTPQPIVLDRIA